MFRSFLNTCSIFVIWIFITIPDIPVLHAQDSFLSQFYANSIYLNPAFTGTSQMIRFSLNYRNQFPELGSSYVNYHGAFDMPSDFLQGGIGINVMNDVQGSGVLCNFSVDGIYSHTLIVNPEFTLSSGLQVSLGMRSLKTGDFILPDGMDKLTGIYLGPNESITDLTMSYPDFATGILGYTRWWYAGIAVHHLTRPNISLSRNYREPLPRRYTLHAGIFIPVFEKRFGREFLQVNPNLVFIQQGSQRQVNLGAEFIRKGLFAGVWVRQNIRFGISVATVVAGYQNQSLRFGYSFDFNLIKPWNSSMGSGAHEIAFMFKLDYKSERKRKYKAIKCPKN